MPRVDSGKRGSIGAPIRLGSPPWRSSMPKNLYSAQASIGLARTLPQCVQISVSSQYSSSSPDLHSGQLLHEYSDGFLALSISSENALKSAFSVSSTFSAETLFTRVKNILSISVGFGSYGNFNFTRWL